MNGCFIISESKTYKLKMSPIHALCHHCKSC